METRRRGIRRSRKIVLLAVGGAVVAVTTGVAAPGVADDDKPLTGSTLERASAAALARTGVGTVVDSEVGDDGATYTVEIRFGDGRQVEVNLDSSFNVIGQEDDDDADEGNGDGAAGND